MKEPVALKRPKAPKTILVHLSHDEQASLDELQGGPKIDEATGLRDYSPLSPIIHIPIIQALFEEAVSPDRGEQHNLKQLYDHAKSVGPKHIGYEPIASDFKPEDEILGRLGEDGDNSEALMPLDVADFLDTLRGGRKRNTRTGLREYGFFDKIFKTVARIGAPIIGGIFGGPIGAAGASALTGALMGDKGKDIFRNAAISGVGSWAAPHIAGALGNVLPGAATGMLNAFGGQAPASGWSQLAGGAAKSAIAPAAGEVLTHGAAHAAPTIGGSLFSQYALPAALIGGGYMLANQGAKKVHQEEQDRVNKQKDEMRAFGRIHNEPLYNRLNLPDATYYPPTAEEIRNRHRHRYAPYKHGGPVATRFWDEHKGDGQSDEIPQTLRSGDWVYDASLVSDCGNGDTNAGKRRLIEIEHIADRTPQVFAHKSNPAAKDVPALVSTGEGLLPREKVIRFGGGSLAHGVKRLRKFTENVREFKVSNKKSLPPAIKSLEKFLPPLKARGT